MYRILLLLLCCQTALPAQDSAFDLRLFDYPANDQQGLFEFAHLPNGELLLYGHHFANANNPERSGIVMTIDAQARITAPSLRVSNTFGQIKDVFVNPDGSRILLSNYPDASDLRHRSGIIRQSPTGAVTDSRAWFAQWEAVTRGRDGSLFCVGRSGFGQGAYGLISPGGELQFLREFLPETRRPASLLDVVTLRNGDFIAVGYVTTVIAGVPQEEITLFRFTPTGELRWAQKLSRGNFFTADGLNLFRRRPFRLQLDADENLYFTTYLGTGGDQRTQLVKFSRDGDLLYARAFLTPGEFAGQSAVHVKPDGTALIAVETTASSTNHGLTAILLNPAGDIVRAVRKRGRVFNVSHLTLTADGSKYLISGTTLDCDAGNRITYVAQLDARDLYFGADVCESREVPYVRQEVPVVVLPANFDVRAMAVDTTEATELAEIQVGQRSVGCLVFEPDVPPALTVGCGNSVSSIPLLKGVRMLDGGRNLARLDISLPGQPAGMELVTGSNGSAVTQPSPTSLRVENWNPVTDGRLTDFLMGLRLQRTDAGNLIGTYPVELRVTSTCGETLNLDYELVLQSVTEAPQLPPGKAPEWCPGDTLLLRAGSKIPAAYRWEDGTADSLRRITTPGLYRLVAENACGVDSTDFTVAAAANVAIASLDSTLLVCPGATVSYAYSAGARTQVQWTDGTAGNVRTWAPDQAGDYRLELSNACATVEHRIRVRPLPGPPALPQEVPAFRCDDDTAAVRLFLPTDPTTSISWDDGHPDWPRTVRDLGFYDFRAENQCGSSAGTFVVRPSSDNDLRDERLNLRLCLGDTLQFRPEEFAGLGERVFYPGGAPANDTLLTQTDTFRLLRTDGCRTASTLVRVTAGNCCSVYLPTAFSPNGDRVNDEYRALPATDGCAQMQEGRISIFDRWGQQVFAGDLNTAWDGRAGGQALPSGDYVVTLRYRMGGEVVRQQTLLTLLR